MYINLMHLRHVYTYATLGSVYNAAKLHVGMFVDGSPTATWPSTFGFELLTIDLLDDWPVLLGIPIGAHHMAPRWVCTLDNLFHPLPLLRPGKERDTSDTHRR